MNEELRATHQVGERPIQLFIGNEPVILQPGTPLARIEEPYHPVQGEGYGLPVAKFQILRWATAGGRDPAGVELTDYPPVIIKLFRVLPIEEAIPA